MDIKERMAIISRELADETQMRQLTAILKYLYLNSSFYDHTILAHVYLVAGIAAATTTKVGGHGPLTFISGLLHDIGAAVKGPEDHHKTGAEIAGKILRGIGYHEDIIIKPVQYCILVHRGSIKSERKSIEAKCVASADGLAHFYQLPTLFYDAFLGRGLSSDAAGEQIRRKLQNDWEKMLPQHRAMVQDMYDVFMKSFGDKSLAW